MDWDRVLERNTEALRRVLVTLFAKAGLGGQFAFFPVSGRFAEGEVQGPVDLAQAANARSHSEGQGAPDQDDALAEESKLSPAPTLPRRLHRAILRVLRPVESAARRLVVVAARGLVVVLPPPRPRSSPPLDLAAPVLRNLGIAVVVPPAAAARPGMARFLARLAARTAPAARAATAGHAAPAGHAALAGGAAAPALRRAFLLPLVDPLPRLGPRRPRTVPPHAAPRILFPGLAEPHRLPPPPMPFDPLDATRLRLRLRAVAAALSDLPGHARRLALWMARRARANANRPGRTSPLKPGRAPGAKKRSTHEVDDILADLHYFAREALKPPDTS